ncbi:hypothetical protein [Burkholderia phage FLC9]|nr:hypothetical protein [Burkholderia phage FLC9]
MEAKDIKAFPDDFTKWLNATAAEGEAGQAVLAKWEKELQALDRMAKELKLVDFEWNFGLVEFSLDGQTKHIGYRLFVKVMNVTPPAQVTYLFRLDNNNRVVDWTKFAEELIPDNKINVH